MTDRREFLMLAHKFDAAKHGIGGWFLSEKIDGQRAFWDGGISRGLLKKNVPWANNAKDSRYKIPPTSTGLWSRLGNVIHAPEWWLDKLPHIMLDGELWHGVRGDGQRQNLSRTIKKLVPNREWQNVKYHIFDMPSPRAVFQDGRLTATHFRKVFKDIDQWEYATTLDYEPHGLNRFEATVEQMQTHLDGSIAVYHPQLRLPFQTGKALEIIEDHLDRVTALGGEGLMLRKPESFWEPRRVHSVLKVKKLDDAEGIVTGFISGRETDKGSKLLGLMGALILQYKGKRLELSGFTEQERVLVGDNAEQWAAEHPGQEVPDWIEAAQFPRGSTVTFRYRGTSLDGIPTEARFWRA